MAARLLLLCCLVLTLGNPAAAAPRMTDGSPELLTRTMVTVAHGRRLNMVCIGKGWPVVVFEQGWGSSILDWRKVQAGVSSITRACFYDRAGMWWSDPIARPSTADNVTDDLHALLRKAHIDRPVVLVGHSLGGLFATHFTDRFGRDVAGLVLLDPSFSSQYPAGTAAENNKARVALVLEYSRRCAGLAREGKLSPLARHRCFDNEPPGYTADEVGFLLPTAVLPHRYEAAASEMAMGDVSREQEAGAARTFGDLPMIVLTAGARPSEPGKEEEGRRWDAHIRRGHESLAARSTRGRVIVVPGAGHDISNDRPQAVIAAIEEIVATARAAKSRRRDGR